MPVDALNHLKVIELCTDTAGSNCGKIFADFGGEVLKVEIPGKGDDSRHFGPFLDDKPDPELSGSFLYYNTNKKSITLDIETTTGKNILKDLIKKTDVLIEDNSPGYLDSIGLSYDELKKTNPGLIMTSITPFGQNGPYKSYKASELNIAQCGGVGNMLPYFTDDMSRPVVKPGGKAISTVTGMLAAMSTLGATFNQTVNNEGCHIDISQQDGLMNVEALTVIMGSSYNMELNRMRHFPMKRSFREPFKCKDGFFIICINTEIKEWEKLTGLIKDPRLETEELKSSIARHDNWDELIIPIIEEWGKKYTKVELFHLCQKAGVSGTPINNSEELFNNEQMKLRGFFKEVDHPRAGKHLYPFAPMKYSDLPETPSVGAPLLGEHNNEIYTERLGFSKEQVSILRESNII